MNGILVKIAWRNIWRNRRRSWVLILAVAIGVFSFMGSISFMEGMAFEMVNSAIRLQGGHIQISARGFQDNPDIRTYLPDVDRIEQAVPDQSGLHTAPRVSTPGMVNSTEQAAGIVIIGVDPARETSVSSLTENIVDGSYLPTDDDQALIMGRALADRLNVGLGEKVVLMASDLDNEIGAGAFRIAGLFQTNSSDFDKTNVYLTLQAARDLIGYTPEQASAFTIRLDPGTSQQQTIATLSRNLNDDTLEILSWEDRFPMLVLFRQAYDYSSILLVVILFTAIAFTIINSFLMIIFERIHEIGIMSANGVRPREIRWMLYLESVFMVLIGCLIGGVLSMMMIGYWYNVGLDLSSFSEGLNSMGISSTVYPQLNWEQTGLGFGAILVMVLLAVLYPAIKASRFEAVDAINYV